MSTVLNHDEQEEIAELKALWSKWGSAVLTVVTVGSLAVAGWSGWTYWQRSQAEQAVKFYHQFDVVLAAKETSKVKETLLELQNNHARTVYAQLASFQSAKFYAEQQQLPEAKAALQWALSHAKDAELKALAQYRLAGVLLDMNAFTEAEALLKVSPPPAFKALFLDRQGDAQRLQGDLIKAKALYEQAVAVLDTQAKAQPLPVQMSTPDESADKNAPLRSMLRLKLETL